MSRATKSPIPNRPNRPPDALAAECRTFDEWKALGRCVRKGQRSKWQDLYGRPVFHESQTDAMTRGPSPDNPHNDPWHGFDVSKTDIDDHFFSDGYMDNIGDR